MLKYKIAIDSFGHKNLSYVTIFNISLNEVMYHSTVNNDDMEDFFKDLQIPLIGTNIKINQGNDLFSVFKNLGYSIQEV